MSVMRLLETSKRCLTRVSKTSSNMAYMSGLLATAATWAAAERLEQVFIQARSLATWSAIVLGV